MKLNITKGVWAFDNDEDVFTKDESIEGDIICEAPIAWKESMENWEANAKLIADAGTTYNTCGVLPSELLKQRDELLAALELFTKGGKSPEWKIEIASKAINNCKNQ